MLNTSLCGMWALNPEIMLQKQSRLNLHVAWLLFTSSNSCGTSSRF